MVHQTLEKTNEYGNIWNCSTHNDESVQKGSSECISHCRDQRSSVLGEEMESFLPHLRLLHTAAWPKVSDFLSEAVFLIMRSWAISFWYLWRGVLKSVWIGQLAAAFMRSTSFWWVWFNEWPETDFPSKQWSSCFPPLRCLENVGAPIVPARIIVTAHDLSRSQPHYLDWHQIEGNLEGAIQLDWHCCYIVVSNLWILVCLSWSITNVFGIMMEWNSCPGLLWKLPEKRFWGDLWKRPAKTMNVYMAHSS